MPTAECPLFPPLLPSLPPCLLPSPPSRSLQVIIIPDILLCTSTSTNTNTINTIQMYDLLIIIYSSFLLGKLVFLRTAHPPTEPEPQRMHLRFPMRPLCTGFVTLASETISIYLTTLPAYPVFYQPSTSTTTNNYEATRLL